MLSQVKAGSTARAADVRNVAPLSAYKSLDETVTGGVGTLQPDDTLLLQLTANTVYDFDAVIHYSGGAAGVSDLKMGWTYPSGTTIRYIRSGILVSGSPDVGQYATETSVLTFQTSGSGQRSVRLGGTILVAVAGTLQLTWCQNSGTATATSVLAGSKLSAWQIG